MTLSTRDQIILSVAIMLLLSLMGTFAGYMAGLQTRQNAAMLAADGVVVDGKITNKVERFGGVLNGPKSTWWVDVTYTTEAGETQTKTIGVDEFRLQQGLDRPRAGDLYQIQSEPLLHRRAL